MLTDALHTLGFRPAGRPFGWGLELGYFGEILDGRFRLSGDLRSFLGISDNDPIWETICRPFARSRIWTEGVSLVSAQAETAPSPEAQVAAGLAFPSQGDCFLDTGEDCELQVLKHPVLLVNAINKARRADNFRWRSEWYIISEILFSRDALYLESRSAGATIRLDSQLRTNLKDFNSITIAELRGAAARQADRVFFCEQQGHHGAVGINLIRISRFRRKLTHRASELPEPSLESWEPPYTDGESEWSKEWPG